MDITYQYNEPSVLERKKNKSTLFLSHYNEEHQEKETPCFFWGKLNEPYIIARSLLTLSKIVASNFMPISASMRDPVITAGANKLRLEAFSSCCSVYGKVTLLPNAVEGEFLQQGTTNVDFNSEMIATLSQVKQGENVFFSVGKKEFVLQKSAKKVVEKKVALPLRWIKGMATVQVLSSEMKKTLELDKLQMQLLFRTIPKDVVSDTTFYLTLRVRKPFLSPIKSANAIAIGAIQRLRLVKNLVPLADKMIIYTHASNNATAFEFHFKNVRFLIMMSKSFWRGFSGEGSSLENLVDDIPDEYLNKLDNYAKMNEEFSINNAELKDIPTKDFQSAATRLSSMGLLGYDLENQVYYYRKLPFKLNRIESLNPRYKNALKIIQKKAYKLIDNSTEHTKTQIKGSGTTHTIIITPKNARCTCTWFATHGISRGLCKHILATKILKNNSDKVIEELLEEFGLN